MESNKILNKVSKATIQKAVTILRESGLVAFPTETVYGLGGDAKNPVAVAKIFAAKGRPADHPVIVHLASIDQLPDWVQTVTPQAQKLAAHFWPGPLTLILPRATHVLDAITGKQDTVGIRVPHHPIAQALLTAFGSGIAAPSANRFGCISPTQAVHVQQELGDVIDLILDGGECGVGIESTIVDVSGEEAKVMRPGSITASQISAVLGKPLTCQHANNKIRAPGMLLSHYAPHTRLQIVAQDKLEDTINSLQKSGKSIVVLARHPRIIDNAYCHWVPMPEQADIYAHMLYACLRAADQLACNVILVEEVPGTEAWFAINDRLQKAATKEFYEES